MLPVDVMREVAEHVAGYNLDMRMNRIIAASIMLILGLVFFGTTQSLSQLSPSRKLGLKVKTIYIDPAYGGNERGPRLTEKHYGKEITLLLAQKLQALLIDAGFTVYLSRDEDNFVPLEDRVMRAKSKGADVYLRIKVSSQSEDCIRLFITSKPIKQKAVNNNATIKTSEPHNELNEIFESLRMNNKNEASVALAQSLETSAQRIKFINCVETQRVFDYILINTEMPAVTVDFGLSKQSKKSPYLLDTAKQDAIVHALVTSIKDYSKENSQSEAH
jgi:N-acetylmuramoyl-L-alanine amidase